MTKVVVFYMILKFLVIVEFTLIYLAFIIDISYFIRPPILHYRDCISTH